MVDEIRALEKYYLVVSKYKLGMGSWKKMELGVAYNSTKNFGGGMKKYWILKT